MSKSDNIRQKIFEALTKTASIENAYVIDVDGVLYRQPFDEDLFLGARLSRRLKAEQGWFESLISHSPTIGTFYEDALRALLSEILPSNLKAGTGFIFDSNKKTTSKQLDIIVYDDSQAAPIYRRGDFAVIAPELAISQSEVKKTLTLRDIREIIRTTTVSNMGTHRSQPKGCARLLTFSYKSKSSTKSIFETVIKEIETVLSCLRVQTKDGGKGTLIIYNITLPSFYFFDRAEFIHCSLRENNNKQLNVEVRILKASSSDSLNEYLTEMASTGQKSEPTSKLNLVTHSFHTIEKEIIIEKEVPLFQKIATLFFVKNFPQEIEDIKLFRFRGKRVIEAAIPASINLDSIKSFEEFSKIDGVIWSTEDEADQIE